MQVTLISHVQLYNDIWNPVASETLNYECEAGSLRHRLIDPRYLEFICLRGSFEEQGTTVNHVPCAISCICTLFLRCCGVIEATVTGP